jgi:hypothetical protein
MAAVSARTCAALAALVGVTLARSAGAEPSLIGQPGMHPDYTFEAEPHLAVGFGLPGLGAGVGPGFRGTLELVDNGFVAEINNTVGLGFGLDWFVLSNRTWFWLPVVMQWNFWLTRSWSVFGEPGGGIAFGDETKLRPAFYGGARLHFSDTLALTLRAGYPAVSVGLSFVL